MRRRQLLTLALAGGSAWILPGRAQPPQRPPAQRVLTSLQATYSITAALAAGTAIEVANVPPQGAAMDSQAHVLSRADPALFRDAAAVVGIGRLWREDPLYPAARAHNLRIVNIDAAVPWGAGATGVAIIRRPVSDVPWAEPAVAEPAPSRHVWLSPTNAVRMAELVAADLARLSPADAQAIAANLAAFAAAMRRLKAEYGAHSAALADPRVLSLADEFAYLFSDLGVFADGWFIRQDVHWTAADRDALGRHLREHGIRVVTHKWQPDASIAAAIAAAGARLAVLDTGDAGAASGDGALPVDGYQTLMRQNMATLLAALAAGAAQ